MAFKEQLFKLRKRKKITQTELAGLMHVRQYIISSWETGRSEPSITQLSELADLFEVSTDYLLDKAIIRTESEDVFNKTLENVKLDEEDTFLKSVNEMTSDLSIDKKEKLLNIIKASMEFENN